MDKTKQNRNLSPLTLDTLSSYKEIITKLDKYVGDYTEKLELLQKGWLQGGLLVEKCSKDASENIFLKLYNCTLPVVLVGEWHNVSPLDKTNLRSLIETMIEHSQGETPMVIKCKYLLKIYDDPWGDVCLVKILKAHPELKPNEEIEFHYNEIGPIMTVRLQKLCDTDCEELALNYSNSCLRCIPPDHATYREIFDINIGLLKSLGRDEEFGNKIEQLSVKAGLAFIQRNGFKATYNGSSEMKELLKNATPVAATILLSKICQQPINTKDACFTYLMILREWLSLHKNDTNFNELVHNILGLAISGSHLYYCSKIIEKGIGDQARYLAIELQIRGITQDLNEIEMNKYDGNVTAETILKLESSLGAHYVRLAELFHDNVHVKRECYLTAFSLRPHQEIFEHVRKNRIIRDDENDFNVKDFKIIECTHEIVSATNSVSKVYCKYCGNYRNADDEELTKYREIFLNAETMYNVPESFHSDLIILVESPRIKQLSWSMPWYELEMNCQKLMDEEKKLELTNNQLVNANDQLQYIDLDYSMFRHLPEAEVPGIEKGYEQYLISSDSESEGETNTTVYVKQEISPTPKNAEKKNYTQYFETSEDSDEDFPLFGQRRKKDKRRSSGRSKPGAAKRPVRQIYIDKHKTSVPPKKRIHRSMKKKFEFDYDNPHARFYITCRKAQLDIKKQRIRLLQKRDGKFFYNFLEEAKIKKPINEDLVRKNVHKLSLMNRNNKTIKEKADEKPKMKQKIVFSSGVVAQIALNGSVVSLEKDKKKRPKPKTPTGNALEIEPNPDAPVKQEKLLRVKKKRPARPRSDVSESFLGPDGQPIPVPKKKKRSSQPKPEPVLDFDDPLPFAVKKKRPSRPKSAPAEPVLGPDGLPLLVVPKKRPSRPRQPRLGPDGEVLMPIRKSKAKKTVETSQTPSTIHSEAGTPQSVIDPSQYEAAEILAQLGTSGPGPLNGIDPNALINHQEVANPPSSVQSILKSMLDSKAKVMSDRKVLTEQNGVVNSDLIFNKESDETLNESLSESKKHRGRPKGVKNKIKLDADGNPLPKPPRKPHKSRNSLSTSESSSVRDSISSVASNTMKIKEEPFKESVIFVTMMNNIEDNPMQLYAEPVNDAGSVSSNEVKLVELPSIDLTVMDDETLTSPKIVVNSLKRKSNELVSSNGDVSQKNEAKKLVIERADGVRKSIDAEKAKKKEEELLKKLQNMTEGERIEYDKREIRLAKKREYDRLYRARKHLEKNQSSSSVVIQKHPTNAKINAQKVKKESLPPALINDSRHFPSLLEVNIPTLPTDSDGNIIPTSTETSIDFETLIKCDNVPRIPQKGTVEMNGRTSLPTSNAISNGLGKRLTRSKTVDSRSNSPKPSKNNLPSHLIQTVNYSFTSHRYNDSGGSKKRFTNFVNYSAGYLPSKTDKLTFNELRSVKEALNETWTEAERVELEQMMSRYWYDIHPCWKIKKESQIIERRDYTESVNNSNSESHKVKDLTKILLRKNYPPKNNTVLEKDMKQEAQFFRNERLVNSAKSGETEFFLNNLMKRPSTDEVINNNDKKNYKNRFCKLFKLRVDVKNANFELEKEDKDILKDVKSDEDVKNYLIATVPGMTDFEFFEMPEEEISHVVEIVHIKSAEGKQDSKSMSDESSTSSSNTSSSTSGSIATVVLNQASNQEKKTETTKKTPTQVTAHIQRIGHPIQISSGAMIKPSTSTESNNRPKYLLQRTVTSPVSSTSSSQLKNQTLINVLSHQVLVPGNKTTPTTNKISVANGTGVSIAGSGSSLQPAGTNVILNNYKPGQTPTKIVKSFPQNWTLSPSITTNAGSSPVTVSTVSSSQVNSQHLLQILNSPPNVRKNLTITSTQQVQGKDEAPSLTKTASGTNGVVQFICKTDGKMIHLTPINNATVLQQSTSESNQPGQSIILNSLVKKPKDISDQDDDTAAPRSVYEENYANFIRTGPKTQNQVGQKPIQVVVSGTSGTQFLQQIVSGSAATGNQLILQNNKLVTASGLPKFNQVFGKTVTMYQQGNSNEIKSSDGKKDDKHIIVQTTSAAGVTQNILIHNKTGRAQILQTKNDGPGLKLITSQASSSSDTSLVTPLRISVPLVPRSQPNVFGQTRIVRPIIQLAPNIIKGESGQNVIVTTTPRQKLAPGQNIRFENLLLTAQSHTQAASVVTTPTTSSSSSGTSKNVDTSTLEQLREFDMVLEQVKERSTSVPSSPQSTSVRSNQVTVINHVKSGVSVASSQQERLQEIIYTTSQGTSVLQKVNFAFLQQSGGQQKTSNTSLGTPLVVVTNYNQNPAISPALSVTSQLSSPTRSLSSVKSLNAKQITPAIAVKPKTMHSPGSASSSSKTLTPKSSPLPKPIQKPQEDEQTVQRIYDILAEYAEQLRNSPDLNNKPAPRRRSNPPTNPATPSTKKKKSGKKYQGGSEVNSDYEGNFESEDSSLGPGSVSGIPSTSSMNNFSPSEPDLTLMDDQSDTSLDHHGITPRQQSQESTSEKPSQVAKQLVFSDGSSSDHSLSNSGNKSVVIKESAFNEVITQAGKLGNNAAVLMPGNYLLPVNLLKSGRQIAILTSANGSKILAAMPGTSSNSPKTSPVQLGSPIKEQMSLQEFKRLASDQCVKGSSRGTGEKSEPPQPLLCLRSMPNNVTQLLLSPNSGETNKTPILGKRNEDPTSGTAIIISSPKGKKRYLINDPDLLAKLTKGGELSSTDVKKLIELQESPVTNSVSTAQNVNQIQNQIQAKVLQMHKHISSNGDAELEGERVESSGHQLATQYQGKIIRSDRKIVDVLNQRNPHNQQAALERELRLQKSLSEECEDLGVDEPEDLFPEAGLLFDNLDPSSQEHGMGIDTPKVDKLTPIFFAEERKPKVSPQTVMSVKSEEKEIHEDNNLGASADDKTEDVKHKEDMYEFNTDEKSSDDNTDTEYNRYLHKKLGRLNNQPPMFSYKRKRSVNIAPSISSMKKRVKTEEDIETPKMITIIGHHSNDSSPNSTAAEDIEDVLDTTVVQSVGATLVVSTEKPSSPHTRRASTRGHVKKNCPCCKPKKNSQKPLTHTHDQVKTPSPVMTRKLRASIGSPSGSSTHSSSSPSTSSSLGGGQNIDLHTTTLEVRRGRNRNTNKTPTMTTYFAFWQTSPLVPVLQSLIIEAF